MSRPPFLRAVLPGVVTGAATWSALSSWHGFVTYPAAYLLIAGGLAATLAVVAALLSSRLPLRAVLVVEAAICLLAVSWTATGSPVPGTGHAALPRFRAALDAADTYRLPLDPSLPSLTPLLVVGAAVFLYLTLLLGVHLRRPAMAGLALLAVFALPAGFSGLGPAIPSFVAAAAGFLVLLVLDGRDRLAVWGRRPHDAAPDRSGALDTLRSAAPTGFAAIAVAVAVAAILPLPENGLLGINGDHGPGVTIHRPVVDMRQDLEQGDDIPLVDVTTDEPDPSYLRIAVLNRFTGVEWSSGDRNVSPQRRANGPVPLPPGLSSDVPRIAYQVRVQALAAFGSTWLPTDFPIDRINAPGDWRYDATTMDFIAAGDTNASNTRYSMTSLRLDYGTSGAYFQDAPPGSVPDEDTEVPGSVPTSVRDLAEQVTARASDDYQKALLLQAFFRETGHFRYSLHAAPQGAVGQTLATFVGNGRGGRVGYCEQFASAMAVMARIVGIPARVAVGFLQPDRVGARTWEYSSHDLHAWPELYFADAGWVRFEPTPAARAKTAPAYSLVPVTGANGQPSNEPTHTPTAHGSGQPSPSARPSSSPVAVPHQGPGAQAHSGTGSGGTLAWIAWPLGLLLVLASAGAAPAVVRRRQRAHRLSGSAESAWTEVRATALDLGLGWEGGRSPREHADRLSPQVDRAGAEASEALGRLVDAVEQVRYGTRERAIAVAARTDVGTSAGIVVEALLSVAARRSRRLAVWLPRSLVERR